MRHIDVDHSKHVFASHRKCLCSVSKGSCTHYGMYTSRDYRVGNAILPFNFRKKGWKTLLIQLVDPSGMRK